MYTKVVYRTTLKPQVKHEHGNLQFSDKCYCTDTNIIGWLTEYIVWLIVEFSEKLSAVLILKRILAEKGVGCSFGKVLVLYRSNAPAILELRSDEGADEFGGKDGGR